MIVMVSLTLLAGLSECDPQQFMRRQDTNMSQTEKSRQRGGQQAPREGKQEPLLDPLDSPLTSPSNLLQAYFFVQLFKPFSTNSSVISQGGILNTTFISWYDSPI